VGVVLDVAVWLSLLIGLLMVMSGGGALRATAVNRDVAGNKKAFAYWWLGLAIVVASGVALTIRMSP
jgi:hypothetical protein